MDFCGDHAMGEGIIYWDGEGSGKEGCLRKKISPVLATLNLKYVLDITMAVSSKPLESAEVRAKDTVKNN